MKHKLISFDQISGYLGNGGFNEQHESNRKKIESAMLLVNMAMKTELTKRQRECLEFYYYDKLSLKQIGEILEITPATVSRHIKKAKERLKRLMRYSSLGSGD